MAEWTGYQLCPACPVTEVEIAEDSYDRGKRASSEYQTDVEHNTAIYYLTPPLSSLIVVWRGERPTYRSVEVL